MRRVRHAPAVSPPCGECTHGPLSYRAVAADTLGGYGADRRGGADDDRSGVRHGGGRRRPRRRRGSTTGVTYYSARSACMERFRADPERVPPPRPERTEDVAMAGYAMEKDDLLARLRRDRGPGPRAPADGRRGPVLHRRPDAGELGGGGAARGRHGPARRPRPPLRAREHPGRRRATRRSRSSWPPSRGSRSETRGDGGDGARRAREVVLDIEGMTCASCVAEGRARPRTRRRRRRGRGQPRDAHGHGPDDAATDLEPLLVGRAVGRATARTPHERRARRRRGASATYRRRLVGRGAAHGRDPGADVRVSDETETLTWLVAAMRDRRCSSTAGGRSCVRAARAARHGTATMDTLVALGSLAAYLYSAWAVVDARPASARWRDGDRPGDGALLRHRAR